MKALFIDNFDSFSFNLVDELEKRDAQVEVWRNDVSVERALAELSDKQLLVLSPGPGTPAEAGSCIELVRAASGRVPIFGVCLGHQVIVEAFGGKVGFAGEVVHGKSARIDHDKSGPLAALPSPMHAARYHSLAALELPEVLRATARTGDVVMAVEHVSAPVFGVQFHPESILTPHGGTLMAEVMRWAARWLEERAQ
jgi:anthranilate synthase component 2